MQLVLGRIFCALLRALRACTSKSKRVFKFLIVKKLQVLILSVEVEMRSGKILAKSRIELVPNDGLCGILGWEDVELGGPCL